MNLYISGSNRKHNSYSFLKDLMTERDKLISLADLEIKYCRGCMSCIKEIPNYCILKDDMKYIYDGIIEADKIIIMTPIYMNQITGILKNVIDRLNPFSCHGQLENKKIYLITVGQMNEEDNKQVAENIKEYFEEISHEIFNFDFTFLRNLSSGDIETIDSIKNTYNNKYIDIINEIKNQIKQG